MKSGKATATMTGVRAGVNGTGARREALATDPLSADDILTGFYRPAPVAEHQPFPQAYPGISGLANEGGKFDSKGETKTEGRAEPKAAAVPVPVTGESQASSLLMKKAKPAHYKIVCISLYVEDIARLDGMVAELKRRGHSKANKSQLIRAALEQVDLDRVPKAP